MPMKLKLDDKGQVVVKDDMPVYVHDDGKEIPFDANATVAKIGALNGEAKSHRERAEAAEGKLAAFKGIDDPAKALQAIETMKNIDASKLVDAGKVEEVKAAAIQAAKEQFAGVQKSLQDEIGTLKKSNEDLTSRYANEKIGGSFTRSPFIAEQMDRILARLERAGMKNCPPKLNQPKDPQQWLSANAAPWAKLANEKPRGETIAYEKLLQAWREGRVK